MGPVNRVYVARLVRRLVLGPRAESFGRVRDVVISISICRQQPRFLGMVVNLATRRSIFIPMLRVAAIEPDAVTLNTGSVSLRHFEQRPGEVLAMGQVLDTQVKISAPALPELAGLDVVITDLGIEQTRTRDWMVSRVAVRVPRRLGRRGPVHVVDWQNVQGLTPSALALPGQGVTQLLDQFEGRRAVDVAAAIRGLAAKRRFEGPKGPGCWTGSRVVGPSAWRTPSAGCPPSGVMRCSRRSTTTGWPTSCRNCPS